MIPTNDRYLGLTLGIAATEVLARLGRPDLIVPRRGGEQWHYGGGRFVLTFAGAGPSLVRVVRRPESARCVAMTRPDRENEGGTR
ncbi:MAG TPA: hypothetical protein PKK12_01585 [Candidatus Aminicenantes bacterium]|nr:hypothetical protein [Candidatus Aminicenantes bacterium]